MTATHPLDPLSSDEIARAVECVRAARGVDEHWRFGFIGLEEPAKAELREWAPERPIVRRCKAVCWDRRSGEVSEAIVNVTTGAMESWTSVPGVQPSFTLDEYHDAATMLKTHPQMLAALAARGVTDPSLVLFDLWAYGEALVPERWRDRRVGWCDVWVRSTPGSSPYANLLGGLHPIVDVNALELLEIEQSYRVEQPATMGEYTPALVPGQTLRDDLKPLEISQPEGPSFTLAGNELRWQRWSMRVGFNQREGLTLHQVGYEDAGELRSVAHRLSFAEMVVPYRDPSVDHARRTAFDVGEWGLGAMTVSLELGCDCLGEIRYLDGVLANTRGEPYTVKNAICIHEEDNAVLWKHVDPIAGAEVRRMRRLVVSFHATVSNYEYLVYWRFYQDGNVECEIRATGIMVASAIRDARPANGTVIDERTYAPYHQHFIVARLDLDIDGEHNTVLEVDAVVPPIGPDNPHGLALAQRATPIRSEAEGARDYSWPTQRAWKVVNPERLNAWGDPVGYKLVPTGCIPPLFDPESPVVKRAEVIAHQLWVTRHADDERWPAGDYPTQSLSDTGLPVWMRADRPLEGEDVVLWYVFGIHHITRVEDWPVMPADTVSFWLKPVGFFDRNPALDVPPQPHQCRP